MRSASTFFALIPSLLLWIFAIILSSQATASPPNALLRSVPFSTNHPHDANDRSWISQARDRFIETIWRIPQDRGLGNARSTGSPSTGPPSTLATRYGGDLVLRFRVTSTEEAHALAEAINVLFLDVWEFNKEWVDIRLSKDVVSAACLKVWEDGS